MKTTDIKDQLSSALSSTNERPEALWLLRELTPAALPPLREACSALLSELQEREERGGARSLALSILAHLASADAHRGNPDSVTPTSPLSLTGSLNERLSLLDQLESLLLELELSLPLQRALGRVECLRRALWIEATRAHLVRSGARQSDGGGAALAALSDELGTCLMVDPDRWQERAFEHIARFFAPPPEAQRAPWEVERVGWSELIEIARHERLLGALRAAVASRPPRMAQHLIADRLRPLVPNESLEDVAYIGARALGAVELRLRHAALNLIYCSPGEFWMGSDLSFGHPNERPRHRVRLTRGFWLGETQVTQEVWGEVMGSAPSRHPGPRHPVEQISWADAVRFCNALSALEGLDPAYEIGEGARPSAHLNRAASGYRLPTEAEWEYAAKAGDALTYAGSHSLDEVAWHKFNAGYQTHPVALKKPNAWGFYDMSGNVYEWCADAYVEEAYQGRVGVTEDPIVDLGEHGPRATRGGSSGREADWCRVAYRFGYVGSAKRLVLGMRVARNAQG
jgi:formylglycine-generating enzyme required for sulfatase activity